MLSSANTSFGYKRLDFFFGHVISRWSITVDPAIVEIVLDWDPLRTITKIPSFGMAREKVHSGLFEDCDTTYTHYKKGV